MTIWESGRESALLDEIIAGRKTIEGRLNRGKFAMYEPGDMVRLRRDIRNSEGTLQNGEPDAARVRVVAVRHYPTFLDMVKTEGFKRVIPFAKTPQEAADEYNKYYPTADQEKYGVLAIELAVIEPDRV